MHLAGFLLIVTAACAFAQQYAPTSAAPQSSAGVALPDAPSHIVRQTSAGVSAQQSERIFGLTPNSKAVSSASMPLSPISGRSLNLTGASSSLIFAGNAPGVTDSSGAKPQLNGGETESGKNCPHARADKAEGSDWITSLVSITGHKGGSYCALGEGGFWKRGTYAATRAFVAHRYDGAGSFNVAEAFGSRGTPGFPTGYYPYQTYAGDRLAARYASAIGRDAVRNMFSEFWPDIATHVLRHRP